MIQTLTRPAAPSRTAWALFAAAAIAVGVGGYFHGHLYHEGYSDVWVVGLLFLLNAIGSAVVVALLVLRRVLAFALGSLSISVGSLVSILISHSTSFIGFAEHRYDSRAQIIVIAEIVATVATLLALAIARRGVLPAAEAAS